MTRKYQKVGRRKSRRRGSQTRKMVGGKESWKDWRIKKWRASRLGRALSSAQQRRAQRRRILKSSYPKMGRLAREYRVWTGRNIPQEPLLSEWTTSPYADRDDYVAAIPSAAPPASHWPKFRAATRAISPVRSLAAPSASHWPRLHAVPRVVSSAREVDPLSGLRGMTRLHAGHLQEAELKMQELANLSDTINTLVRGNKLDDLKKLIKKHPIYVDHILEDGDKTLLQHFASQNNEDMIKFLFSMNVNITLTTETTPTKAEDLVTESLKDFFYEYKLKQADTLLLDIESILENRNKYNGIINEATGERDEKYRETYKSQPYLNLKYGDVYYRNLYEYYLIDYHVLKHGFMSSVAQRQEDFPYNVAKEKVTELIKLKKQIEGYENSLRYLPANWGEAEAQKQTINTILPQLKTKLNPLFDETMECIDLYIKQIVGQKIFYNTVMQFDQNLNLRGEELAERRGIYITDPPVRYLTEPQTSEFKKLFELQKEEYELQFVKEFKERKQKDDNKKALDKLHYETLMYIADQQDKESEKYKAAKESLIELQKRLNEISSPEYIAKLKADSLEKERQAAETRQAIETEKQNFLRMFGENVDNMKYGSIEREEFLNYAQPILDEQILAIANYKRGLSMMVGAGSQREADHIKETENKLYIAESKKIAFEIVIAYAKDPAASPTSQALQNITLYQQHKFLDMAKMFNDYMVKMMLIANPYFLTVTGDDGKTNSFRFTALHQFVFQNNASMVNYLINLGEQLRDQLGVDLLKIKSYYIKKGDLVTPCELAEYLISNTPDDFPKRGPGTHVKNLVCKTDDELLPGEQPSSYSPGGRMGIRGGRSRKRKNRKSRKNNTHKHKTNKRESNKHIIKR